MAVPNFRALPAVNAMLADPKVKALEQRFSAQLVREAIRAVLADARAQIRTGVQPTACDAERVEAQLECWQMMQLRPVINATGVVLHTNLGRAVLAPSARDAMLSIASSYCNLEYDLAEGHRGQRQQHIDTLLGRLLETEGGLVFNNCAGAMLVMLAAMAADGEVIVARSELIEIGGGFRIPEVLAQSQAKLVEVGTTNKVHAEDYRAAINANTRAILKVHRSNFTLSGFVHEPSMAELVELAAEAKIPLLSDVGSGLIAHQADLPAEALPLFKEPTPQSHLKAGVDLVCFSGDKLLGGPQAGIVVGRSAYLERIQRHPLARALRIDKFNLAALEATLHLYESGRALETPTLRDLCAHVTQLKARAHRLCTQLLAAGVTVFAEPGFSIAGGGTLPDLELPTELLFVGRAGAEARALWAALQGGTPPIIARMVKDYVVLDVRTIADDEADRLVELVVAAQGTIQEPRMDG